MPTVLVTGAARGLGLEFVRQYAAGGWRVLACVRDVAKATELDRIVRESPASVSAHRLDVADGASVAALAVQLHDQPIDVLLNNAGTMGAQSFATHGVAVQRFGNSDFADWEQVFRVNVLGPMRMAEAFVEHVAASERKVIATLTSIVGSVASNRSGGMYAYRSAKAAANAVMKSMALDLAPRGIVAVPIHPGWAKTDMGGANAPVAPPESVTGVRRVIDELTPERTGRFWQYDGAELPW
jgi:NAD(P)-dependent dehydrogenase (short-subunit alcohol dehydrogenase family)